jgi:molybdenum ABC transporter, periplasmic molybdate-binding protein
MKRVKKWTLLLIAIFMVAALGLTGCSKQASKNTTSNSASTLKYQGVTLQVYSGAGLNKAMDDIGQAFEQKYGAKVNISYANCAQLLSQMEINKQGDVFVGGSQSDGDTAKQKGFTDKYTAVAYHIPAIAVPKGNPAGITSLADMAKPGIKLILGDEQANAIGKKGAMIFSKANIKDAVDKNVVARAATVNDIVTKIGMKQADAGLVFEDNGFENKDIDVISIPEDQNAIDKIPVCVLGFSQNKEAAQALVDFMSSDEGKAIFTKHGFKVIQ